MVRTRLQLNRRFVLLPRNMSCNRIYFLLRLREGRPGPEFAYDFEEIVAPVLQHCWSRLHRDPQAFLRLGPVLLGKQKFPGHASDDGVGFPCETAALPYDPRARRKSLPP